MIDAQKLLGKVLSGAMQSTGKKKNKKSDNFLGSLVGGLTSGKGLMTALGLGVGAYEIYKQQSDSSELQSVAGNVPPQSMPPVPPQPQSSSNPPPIPGGAVTPPAMPAFPQEVEESAENEQDLAVALIQTMVAAAHADGALDREEEARILEKLQEQGLDKEEKQYILMQLHTPKPISELTRGVDNPMVAQTMYSLAASTIVVDTEQERQWLDDLAKELGISTAMQQFIEEEF
ncbi:MAG: uncharacterized membrane protein YebE (DUF533 family) [Desulforhopalus sp.]|jgi:uncharacterized membrane protein YebE (DUF533 family)